MVSSVLITKNKDFDSILKSYKKQFLDIKAEMAKVIVGQEHIIRLSYRSIIM